MLCQRQIACVVLIAFLFFFSLKKDYNVPPWDYDHHLKRPHLLIQIKSLHYFFSFAISKCVALSNGVCGSVPTSQPYLW